MLQYQTTWEGEYQVIGQLFSSDRSSLLASVFNNNFNVVLGAPDLVPTNSGISPPSVMVGDDFSMFTTVKNIGNGGANNTSYVYYYFGENPVDYSNQIETDYVPSLGINETSHESAQDSLRFSWVCPNYNCTHTLPGTYYINLKVDATSRVSELNENNNQDTVTIFVTRPEIGNITLDSDNVDIGDTIVISYQIYNPASVSKPIGLGASIGNNDLNNWFDDPLNDALINAAPGLNTYTRSFYIDPAKFDVGTYDLWIALHDDMPGQSTYWYEDIMYLDKLNIGPGSQEGKYWVVNATLKNHLGGSNYNNIIPIEEVPFNNDCNCIIL